MRTEILEQIEYKTRQQVRTFLDELANGTSNYRSLHSLTNQIEHQYHGRFVVEILQNAHDALRLVQTRGRVEFWLIDDEGKWGTVYAANDGRSFTENDFAALSTLGQSDKDPNRCVGNKGIGRSVLEISESPEIYSCICDERGGFDGYCFRFDPKSATELVFKALSAVLSDSKDKTAEETLPRPDWTTERLERFRSLWAGGGGRRARDEVAYLSPYLLPLPLQTISPRVAEYAVKGFASLIRLPLKSEQARELATEQLRGLSCSDVLFLEHLSSLEIHIPGYNLQISRSATNRANAQSFSFEDVTVTVSGAEHESRHYWIWSRSIGGDKDPTGAERLQAVVKDLPGRWPELREANVSTAVRVGPAAESGRYSIFLPTRLNTGTSAHVNAPFYGDISRTAIAFSESLNQLLMSEVAHLAVDVLQGSLLSEATWLAGAAVVDLLGPVRAKDTSAPDLLEIVKANCEAGRQDISSLGLFFTDKGWKSALETKLLPDLKSATMLSEPRMRAAATFPVVVTELASRRQAIENLILRLGGISKPNAQELAATIEVAAQAHFMEPSSKDWNGFWRDAISLVPAQAHRPHPLTGRDVVLGSDGRLHGSELKGGGKIFVRLRPKSMLPMNLHSVTYRKAFSIGLRS